MPSSSLPAAMLTELQTTKNVHHTLDLTLAGTNYKYASYPVASASNGLYLPYVINFGSLPRAIGFPRYGLQNPRPAVTIFDQNRDLQESIGGPASGEVIGSSANIVLRSPNVAETSHYTKLTGEIKDYDLTKDRHYKLILGPNTTPVESKLKIPVLGKSDWPTIDDSIRDTPGQMVWGEWVSTSREATGLIQTYMVDETAQYWYVSFGHFPASSITTVFKNGTSDTANWTELNIIVNGRPYTVIENTGSALTIADNITVDCTGLGDLGGGASDVTETDPAEVLKIMLNNVVFGDYPTGALFAAGPSFSWLTDSTYIDTTSFTAADTFLTTLNHEFAGVFTSDQTGIQMIKQWIDTFKCPIFWGDEFKLKIGIFEFFNRDIYDTNNPAINQINNDVLKSLTGKTFGEDRRNRITVNYMLDPISNSFDRTFDASNEDVNYILEDTINYTLGGPSRIP